MKKLVTLAAIASAIYLSAIAVPQSACAREFSDDGADKDTAAKKQYVYVPSNLGTQNMIRYTLDKVIGTNTTLQSIDTNELEKMHRGIIIMIRDHEGYGNLDELTESYFESFKNKCEQMDFHAKNTNLAEYMNMEISSADQQDKTKEDITEKTENEQAAEMVAEDLKKIYDKMYGTMISLAGKLLLNKIGNPETPEQNVITKSSGTEKKHDFSKIEPRPYNDIYEMKQSESFIFDMKHRHEFRISYSCMNKDDLMIRQKLSTELGNKISFVDNGSIDGKLKLCYTITKVNSAEIDKYVNSALAFIDQRTASAMNDPNIIRIDAEYYDVKHRQKIKCYSEGKLSQLSDVLTKLSAYLLKGINELEENR